MILQATFNNRHLAWGRFHCSIGSTNSLFYHHLAIANLASERNGKSSLVVIKNSLTMSILSHRVSRLIPLLRSVVFFVLSAFGKASFRSNSSSLRSLSIATKTSVDPGEIDRFRQLSSSWWNETGDYAALHSLNQLRVPFIREQVLQSFTKASNPIKPLKGLQLMDIGCGGGILTEVCATLVINKHWLFRTRSLASGSSRSIRLRHRCGVGKYLHSEISHRSFAERQSPISTWFVLCRRFFHIHTSLLLVQWHWKNYVNSSNIERNMTQSSPRKFWNISPTSITSSVTSVNYSR